MGRPCNLIPQNFAGSAVLLNVWLHIIRQADVLLERYGRLRKREVVVDAILEHDPGE